MTSDITYNRHEIEVRKNARYLTIGDASSSKLLYVLHGYGQLVTYFISKFNFLIQQGYYIVAPEGLHRFYLEGTGGRVGASWMTKEERESDIDDNLNYLEKLHLQLTESHTYQRTEVLGFSQGGATAARWMGNSKIQFDRLVLWACVFPQDMESKFQTNFNKNTELKFVVGDEDQYYNGENRQDLIKYYEELKFSIILYHGKHQIDSKTLAILFKL